MARHTFVGFLAVLALAGCAERSQRTRPTSTAGMGQVPAEGAAERQPVRGTEPIGETKDANVLAILVAANSHEVGMAKDILLRTGNAEVKRFAQMMIDEHSSTLGKVRDLGRRLGLRAMEDPISRSVAQDGANARVRLRAMNTAILDRAFVEQAITDHQRTLELIDTTLLPAAQASELIELLRTIRPTIQRHLEHAQRLIDTLSP